MSELRVEFYQVEDYSSRYTAEPRRLVCSFDTERFGYLQVGFNGSDVFELSNEPDLNMFRGRDRKYIESTLAIAWRMVFDVPSLKGRFE